ncbi:hypothetical protein VCJ71_03490 [Alteriqipengyuania sp. WL0013]|uniref:hypothetical protein n=1 Tax=Alteriqipengyuania sp. WL0013 TaxID=3110773 RepID=UPI002C118663|nr:hypothetical protein [Alteriqipengyuania sp. WL0013]MEB3415124.1 hypothetical protein [Alteriqipengyuania sp. WL0013]
MRKLLAVMAMLTMFTGPVSASSISLDSAVFVEKVDGGARSLAAADSFRPGETIVTIVRWRAESASLESFSVTSALPAGLRFDRASGQVSVSTDGGATFRGPDNVAGRITHLRWTINAGDAARGRGQLSYRATVR